MGQRVSIEIEKPERQVPIVVPLYAEELSVTKRRLVTRRTRVSRVTREREENVEQPLIRELVEIERRPVGKSVASMPSVRQEGDTIIIPVVEERVVIERQLILKEEIRVRRIRKTTMHRERVAVRRQEVTIARLPEEE